MLNNLDQKGVTTIGNGNKMEGVTITNTYSSQGSIRLADSDWRELYMLTGRYGSSDDMDRLLKMQSLLNEQKISEAKPGWQMLRTFFSGLQHSANLAQIIGTIDSLMNAHHHH